MDQFDLRRAETTVSRLIRHHPDEPDYRHLLRLVRAWRGTPGAPRLGDLERQVDRLEREVAALLARRGH